MEKKFKVTKKTVLKNVEPETFITNEQWVKDNKRFAKFFIIEPIIEEQKEPEILEEKPKKVKKEIVIEQENKIQDNEETT